MAFLLPKTFKFSPLITLICVSLAVIMAKAGLWQWERYKFKVELVESYKNHARSPALEFPLPTNDAEKGVPADDSGGENRYRDVLYRKVALAGTYDYARQVVVINRRHRSGPGFWLLTPFKPDGSESRVIVSRGFIPFKDDAPADWEKYTFSEHEAIDAVVQPSEPHRGFLSPASSSASEAGTAGPVFETRWKYPDIEKMAAQLPYPVVTDVFLQRLGGPPTGRFPAESISVEVPPSTHFGYTIEWFILALASLVVGFLLQAFPRDVRRGWRARTPTLENGPLADAGQRLGVAVVNGGVKVNGSGSNEPPEGK